MPALPPPPESAGAVVVAARRRAGLTQADVAELTGLSVRAISNIERNVHRRLRRYSLDQLTQALGLDTDEVAALWRSPDRPPAAPRPAGSPAPVVALTVVTPGAWTYFVPDTEGGAFGVSVDVDALVLLQDGAVIPYNIQDGRLAAVAAGDHGRLIRCR